MFVPEGVCQRKLNMTTIETLGPPAMPEQLYHRAQADAGIVIRNVIGR